MLLGVSEIQPSLSLMDARKGDRECTCLKCVLSAFLMGVEKINPCLSFVQSNFVVQGPKYIHR